MVGVEQQRSLDTVLDQPTCLIVGRTADAKRVRHSRGQLNAPRGATMAEHAPIIQKHVAAASFLVSVSGRTSTLSGKTLCPAKLAMAF